MLTGAYGSGKSALALAMARLLDTRSGVQQRAMLADGTISSAAGSLLDSAVGCYRVVTASALKEPLGSTLLRAVRLAFADQESTVRASGWMKFARDIDTGRRRIDDPIFVEQLQSLTQQTCRDSGTRGLIIIVDELGQVLEHVAEHPDSGDMPLMQALAEAAVRSGPSEFWFMGVLHGEGAELLDHLGRRGRDQWRKVEQRFVEIPCLPDYEDVMNIVSTSVHETHPQTTVPAELASIIAHCQQLCPPGLSQQAFAGLCASAFPLHPTVLLALPLLARSLGQSHRSVLTFILTPEPFGLQEWCSRNAGAKGESLLGLPDLYDYVCAAFPLRREADTSKAAVLADAQEVLSRIGADRKIDTQVIKCIAVMDLIGSASGLKPSQAVLQLALEGLGHVPGQVRHSIKRLEEERHIVFRPVGDRYHVWQGSDVDLSERTMAAHAALDLTFNLTDTIQELEPPAAIAARRHSIDTGVLRVIPSRVVSVSDLPAALRDVPQAGVVLYCLATSAEELRTACSLFGGCTRQGVLGVVARDSGQLVAAAEEVAILKWVAENTPELAGDRVARQELGQRASEARFSLRHSWEAAFGPKGVGIVYWKGKPIQPATARKLRSLASDMCDEMYSQGPRVRNELLNCDRISSQAAAARHALIDHMVTDRRIQLLGIDGYPPERSMYECVLLETGIHRERTSGEWGFGEPLQEGRSRMYPAWQVTGQLIRRDAPCGQITVSDLISSLCAPPFGLTLGLVSVMLVAYILSDDCNVTVYENGNFVPRLSTAIFERMLKSPSSFSLGWSEATGTRRDVIARLARGLGVAQGVVSVVRGLLERISALPTFSLYTHQIMPQTLQLRLVLTSAKKPEKLLYVDLPAALECRPIPDDTSSSPYSPDEVSLFFDRLNAGLADLSGAYDRLLELMGRSFRAAFGIPESEDNWRLKISEKARLCSAVATDARLRITLLRAQNTQSNDEEFLESLASTLIGCTPKEWTDENVRDFARQTQALRAAIAETETTLSLEQHLGGRPGLLVTLQRTDGLSQTVVLDDTELAEEAVAQAVLSIQHAMTGLSERERWASLAHVLSDSVTQRSGKRRSRG